MGLSESFASLAGELASAVVHLVMRLMWFFFQGSRGKREKTRALFFDLERICCRFAEVPYADRANAIRAFDHEISEWKLEASYMLPRGHAVRRLVENIHTMIAFDLLGDARDDEIRGRWTEWMQLMERIQDLREIVAEDSGVSLQPLAERVMREYAEALGREETRFVVSGTCPRCRKRFRCEMTPESWQEMVVVCNQCQAEVPIEEIERPGADP